MTRTQTRTTRTLIVSLTLTLTLAPIPKRNPGASALQTVLAALLSNATRAEADGAEVDESGLGRDIGQAGEPEGLGVRVSGVRVRVCVRVHVRVRLRLRVNTYVCA